MTKTEETWSEGKRVREAVDQHIIICHFQKNK